MLLVIAATEIEMEPFLSFHHLSKDRLTTCISGVGPVEAAIAVTKALGEYHKRLRGVVNFGIAGAYMPAPGSDAAGVLDICLADREVLGDCGVCFGDKIEPFANSSLAGCLDFPLNGEMLARAQRILTANNLPYITGTFVTVNASSGTAVRGKHLRSRFDALCENMEGAAIARACMEFSLPLLEVRAISNVVEDRPGSSWKLKEACELVAKATSLIIDGLREDL